MTPTRRTILASALAPLAARLSAQSPPRKIERWDRFELQLEGPRDGNPFLDVHLSADFRQQHRTVQVDGFYDGDGAYKVRFSPDNEGEWTYVTRSNRRELDGQTGALLVRRAIGQKSRPRLRAQYLRFRLRRRHALLPFRHHLLRLDPSARRAAAADPRDAAPGAVQQDAHVRLPQMVHVQPGRAARVSVPAARRARTTTRASSPSSSTTWKRASPNCSRSASKPT